jgi:hypothetical protein
MKSIRTNLIALVACLLLLSSALFAHHGTNVSYQGDKMITLNGVMTEWSFAYPHPQLYFDVKNDKGEVEHWAAELLPTPVMMKNYKTGWSRETIKPGDQITLGCNPSKVATAKVCLAKKLTINGKDLPLSNPNAAAGGGEGKQ